MATERMTAPKVHSELCKHLQRHEDKLDSKLHRHDILLVGEDGNEGMVADVRDIKKGYATMKGIGLAILAALLGNMLMIWQVWLR